MRVAASTRPRALGGVAELEDGERDRDAGAIDEPAVEIEAAGEVPGEPAVAQRHQRIGEIHLAGGLRIGEAGRGTGGA